jgi:protein-L-isoaspartate(D-aspartate) O-methyltransferase
VTPAELARMRDRMVAGLTASGQPVSAAVAEAMRVVPRHLFLPEVPAERAYTDEAIVTRRDPDGQPTSSSSQPMIMAIMLDQLQLEPGQRVLEIGAGTGYNAALMKYLVGPDGIVVTVDLDEVVAAEARQHLATAGYPDVTVVAADGAAGYPPQAPYDRIIATVGVSDLAPGWLAQLAPGGRIVVPLDLRGSQRSVAFERSAAEPGVWQSRSVVPCGFMRMRGPMAGPERTRVTDDHPELALTTVDGRPLDLAELARALDEPAAEYPTRVMAGPSQLFDGLGLWLGLHEPHLGVLTETGGPHSAALARAPGRVRDQYVTAGIFEPDSFAVLARPEGDQGPLVRVPGRSRRGRQAAPPFALSVLGYGPHGDALAAQLAALLRDWEAAGRPGTASFRILAYPRPDDDFPGLRLKAGEAAVDRPHTRFVVAPLEKR